MRVYFKDTKLTVFTKKNVLSKFLVKINSKNVSTLRYTIRLLIFYNCTEYSTKFDSYYFQVTEKNLKTVPYYFFTNLSVAQLYIVIKIISIYVKKDAKLNCL